MFTDFFFEYKSRSIIFVQISKTESHFFSSTRVNIWLKTTVVTWRAYVSGGFSTPFACDHWALGERSAKVLVRRIEQRPNKKYFFSVGLGKASAGKKFDFEIKITNIVFEQVYNLKNLPFYKL